MSAFDVKAINSVAGDKLIARYKCSAALVHTTARWSPGAAESHRNVGQVMSFIKVLCQLVW